MPERPDESRAKTIQTMGALSAVGIAFVLAVLIGFLVGYVLDRWLGTSPLFIIVFFFLGLAAGIVNVIRTAASFDRDNKPGSGST